MTCVCGWVSVVLVGVLDQGMEGWCSVSVVSLDYLCKCHVHVSV